MEEFRYRTMNTKLFILFLIPGISILLPCVMSLMMATITSAEDVWLMLIISLIICGLPILFSLEEIKVEFIKDKVRIENKRLITKSISEKEISLSDIMLVQLTYTKTDANGTSKYGYSLLYSLEKQLVVLYFYLSIYTKGQRIPNIKLTPPFTSTGRKVMYNILFTLINSGSYTLSDRVGYSEFVNERMLDSEADAIAYLKSNRTIFKTIIFITGLLVVFVLCTLFTINVLLPWIS